MIEQQLAVAKDLGFDCAFMSRETKSQVFNSYKRFPLRNGIFRRENPMWKENYWLPKIAWTPANSNKIVMEKEDGSYS